MQVNAQHMQRRLERDISRLAQIVSRGPRSRDLRGRCARAYLKALLETKRDSLARLRAGHRVVHA